MPLDHAIDKAAQEALGLSAVKTVDLHSVAVGHDGWKTAHLVPPGDLHVFVGVHHSQQEFAVIGKDHLV